MKGVNTNACPDPFVKGKEIAIQDGYYLEDGKYHWTVLQEVVTDEGGIWKGTCETTEGKTSVEE